MLWDTCPSSQVDVVKVLAKAVKVLSNLSVGASGAGPRATDHFCRAQFSNICLNNRQTSTQKKLYLRPLPMTSVIPLQRKVIKYIYINFFSQHLKIYLRN